MTISPLTRRLAALAILLGLIWLAWAGIVGPVFDGIAQDGASIAQSRQILADYERLNAELPSLEQRLSQIRASGADTAGFLDGPNAAMIAAKLQGDVQQIATAAEVALRSSQTLPPAKEGSFRRIGLQLELGATPAGLQRLLHRIETATPALFVQHLSIRLPEDGTATSAPDGQPQLTIRLELCGYQREKAS
jgi:general secretion pathway protein M